MNKRYLSVALLIWLFSYQIFAAAWAVSNSTFEDCSSHLKSECVAKTVGYMEETMEMEAEFTASHHNKMQINCDHCNIACQPSIISSSVQLSFNKDQLLFNPRLVDQLLHVFINTLFRPPIPA